MSAAVPEATTLDTSKGGVGYNLILDQAKSPAKPVPSSPMTTSVTTLEDVDQKLKAAEERRKKAEEEKLEKLKQDEKHAQEVREKKEKLKAEGGDANGKEETNGEEEKA